jgi:hypothetical protein
VDALADLIGHPRLSEYIRRFLFDQLHPHAPLPGGDVDLRICPEFASNIHVFHSAMATFYAPSDRSGIGGMHRQYIRATPSWRGGHARYDCVLLEKDSTLPGFRGLHAAHVRLFFSFKHNRKTYPCVLIQWFVPIGNLPCEDTGMWVVEPDMDARGQRVTAVVHIDSVVRGAHLLPVYGPAFIPHELHYSETLHAFRAYYVSKYADHHMHEIAF